MLRRAQFPDDRATVKSNISRINDVALSLARQVMMSEIARTDYLLYCEYHGLDCYNFRGSKNYQHEFAKAIIATGSELEISLK